MGSNNIPNKIILVGTSFQHNGSGVSDRNETYFNSIKNIMNIEKLDILKLAKTTLNINNKLISRNLELIYLKKYIRGKNIHVMHINDICSTFPVLDLSKGARKKIVTVHDFYPFIQKPNNTFFQRLDDVLKQHNYKYLKSYDHIIATTEEIANSITHRFNVKLTNISIQGPIIEHAYEPVDTLNKSEKIIIGYINNFTWNKAPMLKYFINIFKSLKSEKIELQIYGNGFPYKDLIKDDSRIIYEGFIDNSLLPQKLSSFTAYLSTSTYEGFGIPIAKAKAMKIPVLCYDGDVPKIMKRNTCLWNENNLKDVLNNRLWEKVNVEQAYLDVSTLRPEYIIKQTIEIYKRVYI